MGLITVSCVTLGKALPSLGLGFSRPVFADTLGEGSLISLCRQYPAPEDGQAGSDASDGTASLPACKKTPGLSGL